MESSNPYYINKNPFKSKKPGTIKIINSLTLTKKQSKDDQINCFSPLPLEKKSSTNNLKNILEKITNNLKEKEETPKMQKSTSKFEEILKLKRTNTFLSKKIENLSQKIESTDLFKDELAKDIDPSNFNEKRINLMKMQIYKQNQLIKNITKYIKITQNLFKQTESLIKYLRDFANTTRKKSKIETEDLINPFNFLDEKIYHNEAVKKLEILDKLSEKNKGIEELNNFITEFDDRYKILMKYQKDSNILKYYFKEKDEKIKFVNPMKDFVNKYTEFFPVRTMFEIMEPNQKDDYVSFLNKILILMKKSDELFIQIKNYKLFKSNPFCSDLPIDDLGSSMLNLNEKIFRINWNQIEILNLESNLSNLLNYLIEYQIKISKNSLSLDETLELQHLLRKNIESLLIMGFFPEEKTQEIIDKKLKDDDMADCISQINKKKIIGDSNETHLLDKKLIKTFIYGEHYIKDLYLQENISIKNFKRLESVFNWMKIFYEQRKMISLIKECDLLYTRKYLSVLQNNFDNLGEFVKEKNELILDFSKIVKNKIEKIYGLVENIIIHSNKPQKIIHSSQEIKWRLNEILDIIKNDINKPGKVNFDSILKIKQEFQDKVSEIEENLKIFKKKTEKIKKYAE